MSRRREPVLLFPGQGAQHARMAAGLYGADPVFSATVDRVLELFADDGRLRDTWLAADPGPELHHVTRAQPLLFTIGYALGRMVLSWGVRPAALLGHSVGELVAATLAGIFELPDAVAVMRDRVERLAATPAGGMVTVAATEPEIRTVLSRHPAVAVGAVNAPRQTVLAGFREPIEEVSRDLRAGGFTVLSVAATSAFHSPALLPLFSDPGPLGAIALHPPRIPMWSAFTVGEVAGAAVQDRPMWATQPVAPVWFWPTLDKLLRSGRYFVTEVGPGQSLATVARRHPEVKRGTSAVGALLPVRPGPVAADIESVHRWVAQFRGEGHEVQPPVSALAG